MADDLVLNAGTGGDTIGADDIAGIKYQRVKLIIGANNTNDGDVASGNPLPISDAAGSLTVDGSVTVTQATGTNLHVVTDSGTITTVSAVTALTNALPAGANAIGKLAANSGVDIGDVDVTTVGTITPGTAASSLGKAEDAAHSSADVGVMMLAVREATATDLSAGNTDGDYEPLQVDANGALHVIGRANASTNVAQINGVTVLMGNGASGTGAQRVTVANDSTGILAGVTTVTTVTTLSTLTGGGVAHDGADSGNPVKVGFKAETSPKGITLVADGDRTDAYADSDGMLMVKHWTSGADRISERVSNTDGASTAFSTFGATASSFNNICDITVHNAHATTNGYVDLRDGTAGSVIWTFPLPATGGTTHHFDPPLKQPTANTALAFDVSAAITTVYISVNGFQSKV